RRAMASLTWVVAKLLRYSWSYRLLGEMRLTHNRMLGDFFLVVTPWRLTSSGSLDSATDTRFCTSTWAMFRSVPSAKVTLRYICPSLVHCEDMYSMFSTPLTSCSMGEATVSATTCASAPGYVAETFTVGGTTSGYCAIGSAWRATRPMITMTMERTVAKTGRSTKKRANIGRA